VKVDGCSCSKVDVEVKWKSVLVLKVFHYLRGGVLLLVFSRKITHFEFSL
jgi:hypothetical protein